MRGVDILLDYSFLMIVVRLYFKKFNNLINRRIRYNVSVLKIKEVRL